MLEKIRVLPLLIFTCCFMLFVRIETIWAESKEIAQQAEATKEEAKPAEAAKTEEAPKEGADTAAAEKPAEGTPAEKPVTAASGAPEPSKTMTDPLLFNDSELDILQSLSARRAQLDERERQIEQKEGLLQITEQRIEEKLAELKTFKAELEATKSELEKMTSNLNNKEKESLLSLVKTYETMKPKDAAARFDNLGLDLQVRIARNLKEAKLAPIMAAMDPMKAAKLTTELATKKDIPGLQSEQPGTPPPPKSQ
jgi:flagellar motility protein MotE (MotC chaperone)